MHSDLTTDCRYCGEIYSVDGPVHENHCLWRFIGSKEEFLKTLFFVFCLAILMIALIILFPLRQTPPGG